MLRIRSEARIADPGIIVSLSQNLSKTVPTTGKCILILGYDDKDF